MHSFSCFRRLLFLWFSLISLFFLPYPLLNNLCKLRSACFRPGTSDVLFLLVFL